jgi:uncharacterized membrane protein
MLAAHKNSVNAARRVIAPWVVVIINVILAAVAMWGILRQYGESTDVHRTDERAAFSGQLSDCRLESVVASRRRHGN